MAGYLDISRVASCNESFPAQTLGNSSMDKFCLLSRVRRSSRDHRQLTAYASHHFATLSTRNVQNTPIFQQGMNQGDYDSSINRINTEL